MPPSPPPPDPDRTAGDAPGARASAPGRARRLGCLPALLLLVLAIQLLAESLVYAASLRVPFGLEALISQLLVLAPAALAALAALDLPVGATLGLRPPRPGTCTRVALFAVANLVAAGWATSLLVEALFSEAEIRSQSEQMLEFFGGGDTGLEQVLLVLIAVVGAPIAEELFYRGLVQNALVRWWGPLAGIATTAALFTFMHGHSIRFPVVLELAIVLGVLYHRSGSLWLVIVFHAATNACGVVASYVPAVEAAFGPVGALAALVVALPLGRALLRELRAPVDRAEVPERLDLPAFVARALPAWVLALILVLLARPFAPRSAVELERRRPEWSELTRELHAALDDRALEVAHRAESRLRAAVKQGRATAQDYVDWLGAARDRIRDAESPLGEEDLRRVLAEEARSRFDPSRLLLPGTERPGARPAPGGGTLVGGRVVRALDPCRRAGSPDTASG